MTRCHQLTYQYFFQKGIFRLSLSLFIFYGCSKKDKAALSSSTDFLSYTIDANGDSTTIFYYQHRVRVRVPVSLTSGANRSAFFSLSPGAQATVATIPQISDVTTADFDGDISYNVTAANHVSQQVWTIQATNNDYSMDWGLGHFLNSGVSNDRDYDWYLDQLNSGAYATVNCGPTAVTMAIKWADPSFTRTPVDARNTFDSTGGWWSTLDIDNYLSKYNIPHSAIALSADAEETKKLIAHQLDNHQILILCIDMNWVRGAGSPVYHVDKFYATTPNWGHFYVVKGYQVIDQELFFEVYDPNSWGLMNADQTFKGKNRFYRYEDVATSTLNWWNYAFVIAPKGLSVNPDAVGRSVNPAKIAQARGF